MLSRAAFLLLFWFSFFSFSFSQEMSELELKKEKALKEIEYSSELLKATEKDRKSSYNKLLIIDERIKLRSDVVNNLKNELDLLDKKIYENQILIESMEEDISKIREEYAKIIYYAFLNRSSYHRAMFILSSKTFNQVYRRIGYLRQYSNYRKSQADLINSMISYINLKNIELLDAKERKLSLLNEKDRENRLLTIEKKQQEGVVKELSRREKELRDKIKDSERIAKRLQDEIERLIEIERRRSASIYNRLTPEEIMVSDNFKANRGKLPWPTEEGIITSRFGEHNHPVLRDVKVRNNGIDISTSKGSDVRALFDGVVSRVVPILGANYTVIIRHGNFLTVYQNLVNVVVKQGDNIKVKQKIGNVFVDKDSEFSVLHLEIWEELEKHNPELWLSR